MSTASSSQTRSTGSGTSRQIATNLQSQTQTQTQTESQESLRPILVLRAEGAETRHIQWAEDVVDNEGMGKKSSKVCCIYHKPHSANESSEDDSSSSDSDMNSDSETDTTKARPSGKLKDKRKARKHHHGHDHDQNQENGGSSPRRPSPNAYERVPKYKQQAATTASGQST